MTSILNEVGQSKSFRTKLEASYSDLELTDLRIRKSRLQLSSGDWVSYKSYYVRQMGSKQKLASRHLSHLHWSCEKGASMSYMSVVSAFSVVSISFEVGKNLLDLAGIKANKSRMRALIKCLSKNSLEQGDTILLDQSDQLSGKRVVIGSDGGRSRMRENNGKRSKKGNACYETPWREPKVIVIRVLNEQGQLERKKSLPIFLATMQSTQRAMKRLGKLLQALGIHQAEHIQFISDGARTIWTNIMKVLRELKVNFSKVTLTLDYYHAREHLSDLVRYLPDQTQQNVVLEQYKDWLWKGKIKQIITDFKQRIKLAKIELSKAMKTELQYFHKHRHRMQYSSFKKDKLLCGSGLVESAVRRIVNLRFKGTSTFWTQQTLEQLLFLRCAFLAGRWNNLLNANRIFLQKLRPI